MSDRRCIPGAAHTFYFTTRTVAGVPSTLSSSPVVKGYSTTGGATEFTTGISITADYDGKTGLNQVIVDMSDTTAYTFEDDFALVITTGTVNSVSVVGEVIAEFTTRWGSFGIVQAGTLSAGGSTTAFTLPSGRRAGVTVGMVLAVQGIGARYIATYNAGTGAGTVTTAFASDPSSTFFRVFVAAPADTASPVPADVKRVNAITIQGAGTSNDKFRPA